MLEDLGDVVGDVAEVALQLVVDAVLGRSRRSEPCSIADSGRVGPLELEHLARQLVDPAGDRRVAAEDLGLDLVDVVLEPGDDRACSRRRPRRGSAYRTASGPSLRSSGSLSIRAGRTCAGRAMSLWRTVITKSGPTKTWSSPNSTSSRRRGSGRSAARRTASRRSARASVADGRRWRPRRPARGDRTRRRATPTRAGIGPVQPDPGHAVGSSRQQLERLGQRRRRGDARPSTYTTLLTMLDVGPSGRRRTRSPLCRRWMAAAGCDAPAPQCAATAADGCSPRPLTAGTRRTRRAGRR